MAPGDCLKLLVLVGWQWAATSGGRARACEFERESWGRHAEILLRRVLVANLEIGVAAPLRWGGLSGVVPWPRHHPRWPRCRPAEINAKALP